MTDDYSMKERAAITGRHLQLSVHFYQRIGRGDDPLGYWLRTEVLEKLDLSEDAEQDYFELISEQFLH